MRKKPKLLEKCQPDYDILLFLQEGCLSGLIKNETSELLDSVTHVITMLSLTLKRSRKKNAQITGEFILDFHKEPAVQILPALPLAGIAASECSEIKLIFATN